MTTAQKLHPQYVTDHDGNKTSVVLPIEEYDELVEDLADLAIIAERRNESTIPHNKVVAELKKDGYLSD